MKHLSSFAVLPYAIFSLAILCTTSGCESLNLSMASFSNSAPEAAFDVDKEFGLNQKTIVDPPFVGERTSFSGLNLVVLEGVGLVRGLPGTGEDPPTSSYRTALLDDMRRRNVKNPIQLLRSPSTAIVIVRAYLPPLVKPGEKFDIEVRLPERSETSSLNGGWLMECNLSEQAVVPGKGRLAGHVMARGEGPILVSTGEGSRKENIGMLRRGNIVGGGTGIKTRNMSLILNSEYRTYRNAKRVTKKIGDRFYSYDKHGHRESLAVANTPEKITLKIHPRYKDNFPRYMRVIQNIAFRESEPEQQVRLERLEQDLKTPRLCELAALQLEAIGNRAVPTLKSGLTAKSLECRFRAAEALAYLGEPDGLDVLAKVAKEEPAFRVFAFAAIAASENVGAVIHLQELFHSDSLETRYGAFRTMSVLDKNDPSIRGFEMSNQFTLHLVESKGEPMVHLTRHQKTEIVLFGRHQKIRTPIAIKAGKNISINSAGGDDKVIVSRYEVGRNLRRVVSSRLSEVIKAAVDMGATYPDIAQMLIQAERQHNLTGRFGIDKLPQSGRYYERNQENQVATNQSRKRKKVKIGRNNLTPNMFPAQDKLKDSKKNGFNVINVNETENQLPAYGGFREQSEPTSPPENNSTNNSTDSSTSGTTKTSTKTNLSEIKKDVKMNNQRRVRAEEGDEKSFNPLRQFRSYWSKKTTNTFLYDDPKEDSED